MITKFLRKRNVNTALPYAKSFARIEMHANGSSTFSFKKVAVSSPSVASILNTESANRMTNELSQYLITD